MIDELRSGLAALQGTIGAHRPATPATGEAEKGADFAASLGDAIAAADRDHKSAEEGVRELAAGKGDIVETMIGITRSELSLGFVVQLRNRALEAYQEIMRLPL